MAPKKEFKIRKGKMIPNKDSIPSPTSPSADGRLKFSDRLKALLNSGGTKDVDTESDDPYTFSEPEPQVLRLYQKADTNNVHARNCLSLKAKCSDIDTKPAEQNFVSEMIKIEGTGVARISPAVSKGVSNQPNAEKIVVENRVSDDESSKTMNRLQAKIAQNKVIGKHKKVHSSSPNPELKNILRKHLTPPKNCWKPVKERSLLEEQLLGVNSDITVKKEPQSPPLSSSSPKYQKHKVNQKQCVPVSIHSVRVSVPPAQHRTRRSRRKLDITCHESLQRIQHLQEKVREYNCDLFPLGVEATDSEGSELEDEEETAVFQRHWFSVSVEQAATGLGGRDGRLAQVRAETRRRLRQIVRGLPDTTMQLSMDVGVSGSWTLAEAVLDAAKKFPTKTAQLLTRRDRHHSHNRSKLTMLVKRRCSYRKGESEECKKVALPCTQHCLRHIMYNVDQLLYEHCTAKSSDNTQCCIPVFDVGHELPQCPEHARKRDHYNRMYAEIIPKKIRKKAKPSAMIRPSKRGKKKRKLHRVLDLASTEEISSQPIVVSDTLDTNGGESSSTAESMDMCVKEEVVRNHVIAETHIIGENHEQSGIEVVEEVVFAMAEDFVDSAELANQARLLEEHDFTNVLNQIPADALNDLFTDKNGQYEPTREETEELERALEAVDKDVKSLERLSQTHGLMESFMDDSTLQTLVQLPEVTAGLSVPGIVPAVFTTYHSHNGFVVNSHHPAATVPDIKNLGPHSTESPALISPCIALQTQTDTPS